MAENANEIALKYLSSRDRTAAEIKKHLGEKGFTIDEINETVVFLSECNLINDKEYCRRYINYGIEKGRGPLRLEKELLDKGVLSDTVNNCLSSEYDSSREHQIALEQAQKTIDKNGAMHSCKSETGDIDRQERIDGKELARAARRLSAQGFHMHVIYEVINKLRNRT